MGHRHLLLALTLAGLAAFGALLQSGAGQSERQQADCPTVISTGSIYIATNCGESGTTIIGQPSSKRTATSADRPDERTRPRRSPRGATADGVEEQTRRADENQRQPKETRAKRGENRRSKDRSTSGERKQRGRTAGGQGPVLIATGDIADCAVPGDEVTAALVRRIDGTVATLGDHAYPSGSRQQFAECYDPSWGTVKDRTRPAPGNHDYETRGAQAYFDYFGGAAGDPGEGYYSYDLGAWHIIVLNSNCDAVGGCEARSRQGQWLRADLAAHAATCTLAYWHAPLFSSGKEHGGEEAMRPAWEMLYQAGADVVLAGHEHNYERFAPQDPNGQLDAQRGIRQFVVGTGGKSLYGFGRPLRTSEVRSAESFGVLVLTLRPSGYDWAFVAAGAGGGNRADSRVIDDGSGDCH
jgi:acid phosphatase type 7